MRRATQEEITGGCDQSDFYPRSPCGERRSGHPDTRRFDAISIHALLAESDFSLAFGVFLTCIFLSTLSLRRATLFLRSGPMTRRYFYPRSPCGERRIRAYQRHFPPDISIHALLAESDDVACGYWHKLHHFYPRSPCGERHWIKSSGAAVFPISIHALLAESDSASAQTRLVSISFLSTLSLRRATRSLTL